MIYLLFFTIAVLIAVAVYRHQPHRLTLGTFTGAKTVALNGCRYYVEEVRFADYQAAIHGYFNLVPVLQALDKAEEERWDFFDFYSVAIRFEHSSARLLRLVDRVRLIQSDRPIPLDEFEQHIQSFAYQDLK